MLSIKCPWCGPRDDAEFHYGGEAHVLRPKTAEKLSDQHFAEYLFFKQNPKGPHLERWHHSYGCRKWFNALRDTATNEILEIYPIGSSPHTEKGKQTFRENWRRQSVAEENARQGDSS